MGKKNCCDLKCGLITAGIIGGILVIIGGISVAVFDLIFHDVIIQQGTIKEGTIMYDQWVEVTTPTYLSYYFYNVTNSEEFLNQTSDKYVPPNLQELGPYTFREYLSKDNVTFQYNLDPEEVFYRQKTVLFFDPDLSKGSLDDSITTINVVGASVARIVDYVAEKAGRNISRAIYRQINKAYVDSNTQLLFTKSVNDIIFGFEDPLYQKIVDIFAGLGVEIPPTFGLFATMNTSAGWFDYQVYTGQKHPELINVLTHYKGMSELTYWGTPECNMINGTDGSTTPPFMDKEEKVYFFIDDVCRSLYATFKGDVEVKRVPAWSYSVPPEVFQSPLKNPDNRCFCPHPEEPLCQHDGAILIESCMAGAPILISSPHFLYGDDYWFNHSTGLSPATEEEHGANLVYEPNTGTAIQVDKRLQVNILLMNNPHIDILNVIQDAIAFPVVWLNESAVLGESDADLLYGLLVKPAETFAIVQIVFCIVGAVLLLATLFYALVASCKRKSKTTRKESKKPITKTSYNNTAAL